MKFNILIISLLIFVLSCANINNINYRVPETFNANGFAYIYEENDFENKIISKRIDNTKLVIGHNLLTPGTRVIITNPENNKSITSKITKKLNYPSFYNALISSKLAQELNLNPEFPYIEITPVKKNKTFIAKKAETHVEEMKVSNKAPVTSVKIENISKVAKNFTPYKNNKYYILIADFYSNDSALFLKKELLNQVKFTNKNLLKIKKANNTRYELLLGPYQNIKLIKQDFLSLKTYGFDDIDIIFND